ncbi:protein EI24 homolog [Typha latifolia]|uniref:protein EI24 homolog n=1 Tax=Typha latifolia TaxID=4733 RepID=UPI003C2F2DBA
MEAVAVQAKQATLLWLAGFKEACCLHRVAVFSRRSRPLLIRTGQCFLLNGLIFLGSLFIVKSVVAPILLRILPEQCEQFEPQHLCDHKAAMALYSSLRSILINVFYVLWFYPLYVFSLVLSAIWYNDIAKHAFDVMRSYGKSSTQASENKKISDMQEKPGGLDGVILGIGEQVYSFLLLVLFFIEVSAIGFIPYLGKAINFLLLPWLYSYYCFEYKWNFAEVNLNERLDFFESNWAFFAGFGSPCVFATFFLSPLVSAGVMAMLYPLFVVTAAGTEAEQVIDSLRRSWGGGGPRKIQVFYAAKRIFMLVLHLLPETQKEQ